MAWSWGGGRRPLFRSGQRSSLSFIAGMLVSGALFFSLESLLLPRQVPDQLITPRQLMQVSTDTSPIPLSPQPQAPEAPIASDSDNSGSSKETALSPEVLDRVMAARPNPAGRGRGASSRKKKKQRERVLAERKRRSRPLAHDDDYDDEEDREFVLQASRRKKASMDDDDEDGDSSFGRGSDDDDYMDRAVPDGEDETVEGGSGHDGFGTYTAGQRGKRVVKRESVGEGLLSAINDDALSAPAIMEMAPLTAPVEGQEGGSSGEEQEPPLLSEPIPVECQDTEQWLEEAQAIMEKYEPFHRLDRVCFDYKQYKVYAADEEAQADVPHQIRHQLPFPFGGVLPPGLANRTRHMPGETLFLRTKHDGMHGRWDHLLQWANTVLPLASARFVDPIESPSWPLRRLRTVVLYGVSEQDYYSESARWMRELLDGTLDYVHDEDAEKETPERVFLTVDGMRKRPLMCFDTVMVSTPHLKPRPQSPQQPFVVAARPPTARGSPEHLLSRTATAMSGGRHRQVTAALGDDAESDHHHHRQHHPRPWQFFPTPCAAFDLKIQLLTRLHIRHATNAGSSAQAPLPATIKPPSATTSGHGELAVLLLRSGAKGWLDEDAVVKRVREEGWQTRVLHVDRAASETDTIMGVLKSARLLISQRSSQLVNMIFLPHSASVIELVSNCTASTPAITTTTTTTGGASSAAIDDGSSGSSDDPQPQQLQEPAMTVYARLASECSLTLITATVGSSERCGSQGAAGGKQHQHRPHHHPTDSDKALQAALEYVRKQL